MERKPNYVIPVGTRIEIRKIDTGDELRQHTTRRELTFKKPIRTGYNESVLYFEHEGWTIAVHAYFVNRS